MTNVNTNTTKPNTPSAPNAKPTQKALNAMANDLLKNGYAQLDEIATGIIDNSIEQGELKAAGLTMGELLYKQIKGRVDAGESLETVWNNLQFILGYNYKGDTKTGAPDASGKLINRGKAFSRSGDETLQGLVTYKSMINSVDKKLAKDNQTGVMLFDDFKSARAALTELQESKKQADKLLEAIKAMRADFKDSPELLAKMETNIIADIVAEINHVKNPPKSNAKKSA